MAISTESWQTILSHSDNDASKLVERCASEGDLTSIRMLADTGIFENIDALLRPRYVEALASMFLGAYGGDLRSEKLAILERCFGYGEMRASANAALVRMISRADQNYDPSAAIVAFVDSGVDPMSPAYKNGSAAIDAFFERLNEYQDNLNFIDTIGIDMMKALLGKKPEKYLVESHAFQVGCGIDLDLFKSTLSVFEMSIALDYSSIVSWSKTIAPDYPQELKLSMGDHALEVLSSRLVSSQSDAVKIAMRLIAAGAEMRDGKPSWERIAEEILPAPDGPIPFFQQRESLIADRPNRTMFNHSILTILRNAGVDINQYDFHGFTLLMKAVAAGNVELTGELIALGADPTLLSVPRAATDKKESALDILDRTISACEALGADRSDGIAECRVLLLAAAARHAIGSVIAKSAKLAQSARQFSEYG